MHHKASRPATALNGEPASATDLLGGVVNNKLKPTGAARQATPAYVSIVRRTTPRWVPHDVFAVTLVDTDGARKPLAMIFGRKHAVCAAMAVARGLGVAVIERRGSRRAGAR